MNTRKRSISVAAFMTALLCVLVEISGCATRAGADGPTSMPTATARPWFAQPTVSPASSARGAVSAAVEAVNTDQAATLQILEGKVPFSAEGYFEDGPWLKTMDGFLNDWGDGTYGDGGSLPKVSGRASVWRGDPADSFVAPLVRGGSTYRYGVVHMLGCFEIRDNFLFQSDGPVGKVPVDRTTVAPYIVTVTYEPSQSVWLVTDEIYLGNRLAALDCSGLR